jgi:hypothetical protein
MAQRITESMLNNRIVILNMYMNTPKQHYAESGKVNPGHYYLSYQNGGVAMYQAGAHGDRDVFGVGFVSKPMIYELLSAFIRGVQDAKAFPSGIPFWKK